MGQYNGEHWRGGELWAWWATPVLCYAFRESLTDKVSLEWRPEGSQWRDFGRKSFQAERKESAKAPRQECSRINKVDLFLKENGQEGE